MKYSKGFIRDITFYLRNRHKFTFTGSFEREVVFDKQGIDGIKAFYIYDSQGILKPTKHPLLLSTLLEVKASVNFNIKQWAQARAKGDEPSFTFSLDGVEQGLSWNTIPSERRLFETQTIEVNLGLPNWAVNAVEQQKSKYY